MPYITTSAQKELTERVAVTAGELNYTFTMMALSYLGKNPNYQRFNDVMGALEGCKLELYRRRISGYEDTKIVQNGDVYGEGK